VKQSTSTADKLKLRQKSKSLSLKRVFWSKGIKTSKLNFTMSMNMWINFES